MSIQHREFNFSGADGLQLFGQSWMPEGDLKGCVCLAHGLGEHSGRFAHVAAYLADHEYAFFGFDHRGYGRSQGLRGHISSFDDYMNDIEQFLALVREKLPKKPLFLYGQSLGGVLVLSYALRRKPDVDGIIATAPALRTAVEEQKFKKWLAETLGALFPRVTIPSGLEAEALSRDPKVVQAYNQDPLVHSLSTLGWGKEMIQGLRWIHEHVEQFPDIPLLIMHGTDDRIAYPEGSQRFCERVPNECTLKLWEGLYHELHNEPEKEQVLDYLRKWLDEKVGANS